MTEKEAYTTALNNYYNPKSHWYKDKEYLEHYKLIKKEVQITK